MEPITVTCCHCNRTQKLPRESVDDEDTYKCTTCAELCIICMKNNKVGLVPGSVDADPLICYQCNLNLGSNSEFDEEEDDDRSAVQMSHEMESSVDNDTR